MDHGGPGAGERVAPELAERIEKARKVFDARPEISCAYLFGSCARGQQTPLSDIDFAVWRKPGAIEPSGAWRTYEGDLRGELARALALPESAVDVVVLDRTTDPLLRHRATWCGRLILCRDDRLRVRLEAAILLAFLDTAELRRIQGAALERHYRGLVTPDGH